MFASIARHPSPRRTVVLAAFLFTAPLVLTPASAEGQISALAKKAASKLAKQSVEASGVTAESPTFDNTILELDETRSQSMLVGLQAARTYTAPDGATRAVLLQRAGAAHERRNALLQQHEAEQLQWQSENERVTRCTSGTLDSLQKVKSAEIEKKARALASSADPMNARVMQDIMKATAKAQQLMAAGDTAGAIEVQRALARSQGIDPAQDSVRAAKRCGQPPKVPAWQREAESLLASADEMMQQARLLDEQAASAGAKAAGMSTQQFAIARERIEAYVAANGTPRSSWRFSMTERTALLPKVQQFKAQL